jgi:coenzyme F420 hydrogenase subunit beta
MAKGWNQVITRTSLGEQLMALARSKGVLEFREVPEGNLERLKNASMSKKKTAEKNLAIRNGQPKDNIHVDSQNPGLDNV